MLNSLTPNCLEHQIKKVFSYREISTGRRVTLSVSFKQGLHEKESFHSLMILVFLFFFLLFLQGVTSDFLNRDMIGRRMEY